MSCLYTSVLINSFINRDIFHISVFICRTLLRVTVCDDMEVREVTRVRIPRINNDCFIHLHSLFINSSLVVNPENWISSDCQLYNYFSYWCNTIVQYISHRFYGSGTYYMHSWSSFHGVFQIGKTSVTPINLNSYCYDIKQTDMEYKYKTELTHRFLKKHTTTTKKAV